MGDSEIYFSILFKSFFDEIKASFSILKFRGLNTINFLDFLLKSFSSVDSLSIPPYRLAACY